LHFCGGVLESLSTSSDIAKCEMTAKTSCCSQKNHSNSKGSCCDNTTVDFSDVDTDSLLYDLSFDFQPLYLFVNNYFTFDLPLVSIVKRISLLYTYKGNAPPLYKLYGTYIYYA
jgi:hypothetical protein